MIPIQPKIKMIDSGLQFILMIQTCESWFLSSDIKVVVEEYLPQKMK
jgi:hypothetical protein